MPDYQRSNGHTLFSLTAHIVWSTKYWYSVLQVDILSLQENSIFFACLDVRQVTLASKLVIYERKLPIYQLRKP